MNDIVSNNGNLLRNASVNRFLGGSPLAVAVRLIVVSLVVGALMVWQGIDPADLIYLVERIVRHLWQLGFNAFHDFGRYLMVGGIVVVPIWLIIRLLNWRRD